MPTPNYEWQWTSNGQSFIISNKVEWQSHEFIQKALDHEQIYWAQSMAPKSLDIMLSNCCMLGLYALDPASTNEPKKFERTQIGMARIVTDYVTIAFLTDVFVLPDYQGKGLGKWMIACVREVMEAMPEYRVTMLFTALGKNSAAGFYEKELGMKVFQSGDDGRVLMVGKGKSFVSFSDH